MALDAGNKIVNTNSGTVVDGKDVGGGFFVTETLASIPSYANVQGALCYNKGDGKFYQRGVSTWEEADLGGGGTEDYASVSNFPATGEAGVIYLAKDTNNIYRYDVSNSEYVELSPYVSEADVEVITHQTTTALTDAQWDKAKKGKLIIKDNFGFPYLLGSISNNGDLYFYTRISLGGFEPNGYPRTIEVSYKYFSISYSTKKMSSTSSDSRVGIKYDMTNNFFVNTASPSSNEGKIVLGKNLARTQGMIYATEYSASTVYKIGDLVTRENNLYECNTDMSASESWTSAHWTQTTLGDYVKKWGVWKVNGVGGLLLDNNNQLEIKTDGPGFSLTSNGLSINESQLEDLLDFQRRATVTLSLTQIELNSFLAVATGLNTQPLSINLSGSMNLFLLAVAYGEPRNVIIEGAELSLSFTAIGMQLYAFNNAITTVNISNNTSVQPFVCVIDPLEATLSIYPWDKFFGLVTANPTIPNGVTPIALTGMKINGSYYSIPSGSGGSGGGVTYTAGDYISIDNTNNSISVTGKFNQYLYIFTEGGSSTSNEDALAPNSFSSAQIEAIKTGLSQTPAFAALFNNVDVSSAKYGFVFQNNIENIRNINKVTELVLGGYDYDEIYDFINTSGILIFKSRSTLMHEKPRILWFMSIGLVSTLGIDQIITIPNDYISSDFLVIVFDEKEEFEPVAITAMGLTNSLTSEIDSSLTGYTSIAFVYKIFREDMLNAMLSAASTALQTTVTKDNFNTVVQGIWSQTSSDPTMRYQMLYMLMKGMCDMGIEPQVVQIDENESGTENKKINWPSKIMLIDSDTNSVQPFIRVLLLALDGTVTQFNPLDPTELDYRFTVQMSDLSFSN